jgi:zinc D-Ala-D-Ala carboxypeptidase
MYVRLFLMLSIGSSGSTFCVHAQVDPALRVVNKKISLGKYVPTDLVPFNSIQVSKRIVKDLKNLLAAAKRDGLTLKAVSGYRSFEKQRALFNRYVEKEMRLNKKLTRAQAECVANRYSAYQGHSEHQLGTAVDVLSAENGYAFESDKKLRFVGWLEKNAHRFHFKISFYEGHPEYMYEPWHIRWYPQ